MIRRRPVALVVVLGLAATLLAGCRTNVGTAARVGDQRISENRVNSFVTPTGASSSEVAAAASTKRSIPAPKTLVVQYLVSETIFERATKKSGGLPSAGTLSALRDRGLQAVLQVPAGTPGVESQLAKQLESLGVKRSFVSHVVRFCELVYYLGAERLKASSLQDAFTRAAKLAGKITVSPRYGTWDPSTFGVTTTDSDTPPYLTLRPTASASPAP